MNRCTITVGWGNCNATRRYTMNRFAVTAFALATLAAPLQAQTVERGGPYFGLATFSSDGSKLGYVQCVLGDKEKPAALVLSVGGFLGIGGKFVEIQEGKFGKSGKHVQLNITADETKKLPGRATYCN
jgi:hypothetical protein